MVADVRVLTVPRLRAAKVVATSTVLVVSIVVSVCVVDVSAIHIIDKQDSKHQTQQKEHGKCSTGKASMRNVDCTYVHRERQATRHKSSKPSTAARSSEIRFLRMTVISSNLVHKGLISPEIGKQPGSDAGRGVDDIEAELSVLDAVVTFVVVVVAVAGACTVNVIGTRNHVDSAFIQQ